jgi:hypothetical protein
MFHYLDYFHRRFERCCTKAVIGRPYWGVFMATNVIMSQNNACQKSPQSGPSSAVWRFKVIPIVGLKKSFLDFYFSQHLRCPDEQSESLISLFKKETT